MPCYRLPVDAKPNENVVIVCQGQPLCELEGDAAVDRQLKGCPICKHVYVNTLTGQEREHDPIRSPN